MLWQGLSSPELCRMLKDPGRNGNRKPQALVEHMESEPLVLWGWNPGKGRELIPLSHELAGSLLLFRIGMQVGSGGWGGF
jgi:hypothetical protein